MTGPVPTPDAARGLLAADGDVAVAYSGGRDSTALLHATAHAARAIGRSVHALHVHHGLQPEADEWLRLGRETCRRWRARGLPVFFVSHRLSGSPAAGDSVEAWARRERYRALDAMAREAGCALVLLAHHRQDQAETFLLQALRGAGAAGLAGMPRTLKRDGLVWARPWLDRPPVEIEAYVRRHRLRHVDDPSNAGEAHARSRLRVRVWPALEAAFPEAMAGLVAAASQAGAAASLARECARDDLRSIGSLGRDRLDHAGWSALSVPRRANALRQWLLDAGAPVTASLLERVSQEAPRARGAARWPVAAGLWLHRHGGALTLERILDRQDVHRPPFGETLGWPARSPAQHTLPGYDGRIELRPVASGGLAVERLPGLRLVRRRGGERFSLGPGRPSRPLKQQFQALGVPAWQRDGPMLADGGGLVFVAGLGLEAGARSPEGVAQVEIRWHPAPGDGAAPR